MRKHKKKVTEDVLGIKNRGGKIYSNINLITNLAVALFGATLERLKFAKKNSLELIDNEYKGLGSKYVLNSSISNFWKDENFCNELYMSEVEDSLINFKSYKFEKETHGHFIDILIEKAISRLLFYEFLEREHFIQSIADIGVQNTEPISVTTLSQNFRILTSKLGAIFALQHSIIKLFTWKNFTGTVFCLIIYTYICYRPMFFLIFCVCYVLFKPMILGYMHRHPLRRNNFSRISNRKSFFEFVFTGGETISTPTNHNDILKYNCTKCGEWMKMNHIRQTVEFIINLRNLQNLASKIVKLSEILEIFIYGDAGFLHEHRSTALFLSGLILILLLFCISAIINFSFVVSASAWIIMIVVHPKILPKFLSLFDKKQIDRSKIILKNAGKYHIILDEPPEIDYIEIFEIFRQHSISQRWEFYIYSSDVFNPMDICENLKIFLSGVSDLKNVFPPVTWSFDNNSKWEVDLDVQSWAKEKGLTLNIEGEFLVGNHFKKRRLTRKVFRYASPARMPSYR